MQRDIRVFEELKGFSVEGPSGDQDEAGEVDRGQIT